MKRMKVVGERGREGVARQEIEGEGGQRIERGGRLIGAEVDTGGGLLEVQVS